MTDMRRETSQSTSADPTWRGEPEPSGWVGWIAFAGTMMLLLGTFHVIQGIIALVQNTYYLVGTSGLVVNVDYTQWGWTHIILGALVLGAGLGLLVGQMWARVVAVIVAFGSAIVNVAFLAAYPVWSTIMIAIDVLVIWAVLVHGREMKSIDA
jgi:hypothetical protein